MHNPQTFIFNESYTKLFYCLLSSVDLIIIHSLSDLINLFLVFFMYPHRLAGFSLIEVLISLLLLSFILLGFDATEIYSARMIRATYYFNVASHQLNNITERLHMLENDMDIDENVAAWNAENQIVLPQGIGEVAGYYPNYIITIYWGKKTSSCEQNQQGNSGCIKSHIIL
jgi:hypothetical protein